MFKAKMTANGAHNVAVQISGGLPIEEEGMFTLFKFDYASLKLTSVLFLVQEKAGLYLWWGEENLILPAESRGAFKFEIGIKSPEGWDGTLWGSSFKTSDTDRAKGFLLLLDFDR